MRGQGGGWAGPKPGREVGRGGGTAGGRSQLPRVPGEGAAQCCLWLQIAECVVRNSFPGPNITWLKDGHRLHPEDDSEWWALGAAPGNMGGRSWAAPAPRVLRGTVPGISSAGQVQRGVGCADHAGHCSEEVCSHPAWGFVLRAGAWGGLRGCSRQLPRAPRSPCPTTPIPAEVKIMDTRTQEASGLFTARSRLLAHVTRQDRHAYFQCQAHYLLSGGDRQAQSPKVQVHIFCELGSVWGWHSLELG